MTVRSWGWAPTAMVMLSACWGRASSVDTGSVVRDSAGVMLVENVIPSAPPTCAVGGPVLTIGETEGPEEYQLYRVFGARRLSHGGIVLVNQGSQELRYYDSEGVFVGRAGREGGGPGEFSRAFYLWVTEGDTVWAGDYRPWQFHVFAPDGEWVRTVRPYPPLGSPPDMMTVLTDSHMVLAEREFSATVRFEPRSVTPVLRDRAGEVVDTVGTYDQGRWGQVGGDPNGPVLYPLFESFTRFDGAGSSWYLGHGSEPEVSVFEADHGVVLKARVRWNTNDRTVTSSDVAAEKARIVALYPDADPVVLQQLVTPLISDDRPVAERLPAFDEIVANRAGGFWVRAYTGPAEVFRWLAFDADGRFRCEIRLPDVEITDLGADYLIVEQQSPLGVEQVAMYELGEPVIRP